jgi:transaldolase/glucose-6-phosphate isomerase
MTKLHQLAELGQSVWLDYIRRSFIKSGELQAFIDKGLRGLTSNPSIFEKAITGSTDYDHDIRLLIDQGKSDEQIYEALVLEDIRRTADLLRPVYDRTDGFDGYVSLEANPKLAHDTAGTIDEVHRLFKALDCPNVMIKVPATPAGMPAIETLISEGINVNVTLIFSLDQYEAVVEAYIKGLEKLADSGGDVSRVASVASFFVSRVDTKVDQALEEIGESDLQGQIAIANAKMAYAYYNKVFSGSRWKRLASENVRPQRVLWGSTSTKNPEYPDTYYVDNLVGANTVNTVPPATLQAFLDHGTVTLTLPTGLDEAEAQLACLADLGVDLDALTQQLLEEGVTAFADSYNGLIAGIAKKRRRLLGGWQAQSASLGSYQAVVDDAMTELANEQIINRIWTHDHTVWQPEPTEISNRLGWLHSPQMMQDNLHRLDKLVDAVRSEGYTHVLVLGMGGASLAADLFSQVFESQEGYPTLAVLDSTTPGTVSAYAEQLDPARTLFVVSSKSGTTIETHSFFKFFYNRVVDTVGKVQAGAHFVAITDPGSLLANLADRYDFRATFLNDPNIGGRYSALSYFGLVPAALMGLDVPRLLNRALMVACACESCVPITDNPGARLGIILGELAKQGRNKVTFITSPRIDTFGDWVEQLLAESTGKEGQGILPVVREPLGLPATYGEDRLFIYLQLVPHDDEDGEQLVQSLEAAGQPVVRLYLTDRFDLGGQFFLWEMATAVACQRLGVNPFNQPNVEVAKKMASGAETNGLLAEKPVLRVRDIAVYGDIVANSLDKVLTTFLDQAQPGDYVAVQAYVQPPLELVSTLESSVEPHAALLSFCARLRDKYQLATTLGYGPRYLHSTGQLHKGDAGNGLFIQFTADDGENVSIPDEPGSSASSMTFGTLKTAQALGDRWALLEKGRRVIRFHLGTDVVGGLNTLSEVLVS